MEFKTIVQKLALPLILVVTLGFAPFSPEPHLFGKLRWLWGGAHGMGAKDWFDLVLHGFPFIYLILTTVKLIRHRTK